MSRVRRWTVMAVVNLATLSCAFGVGWRSSTLKGEQLHPPRTGGTSYDAAAALEDARTVLAINCGVLFRIVLLGMFSAGAYGLLLLGVNGYGIGHALAAVSRASPAGFWYALSYAPLEFAAFVAANCAVQMLTCSCVDWLRQRPTSETRGALAVLGCTPLLLVVAAVLEAHAIQSFGSVAQ